MSVQCKNSNLLRIWDKLKRGCKQISDRYSRKTKYMMSVSYTPMKHASIHNMLSLLDIRWKSINVFFKCRPQSFICNQKYYRIIAFVAYANKYQSTLCSQYLILKSHWWIQEDYIHCFKEQGTLGSKFGPVSIFKYFTRCMSS